MRPPAPIVNGLAGTTARTSLPSHKAQRRRRCVRISAPATGPQRDVRYLGGMKATLATLFTLAASGAWAWDARITDVCEIYHEGAEGEVLIRYDPSTTLYSLTVTRPNAWPSAPVFAIRFGQTGLTISTTRHQLSGSGQSLSVSDSGFGNVLLGLETAATATAFTETASASFDLDGAGEAVADFRSCLVAPSV